MSFPHVFLFLKKSYIEDALKDEEEEDESEEGEKKDWVIDQVCTLLLNNLNFINFIIYFLSISDI